MGQHKPSGIKRWFYTTDHSDVGAMYLWHTVFFLVVAGAAALAFRLELMTPSAGQFLTQVEFNSLVTLHGGTMIFIVAMSAVAVVGNYFIPPMVGADEMAYPRANALSYWCMAGGSFLIWVTAVTYVLGVTDLPFNGGWTTYAPLSLRMGLGGKLWFLGIVLTGTSSTVGSVNFLVTILNERDPEMGLFDMPVFIWAMAFEALLAVVALVPLVVAMAMTFLEATYGFVFFDPANGGSPILYQHFFWLFGHPEVYLVLLPFLGSIGEIIPRFSGRPLYGYKWYVAALGFITTMSALVWAHHMYTTGSLGGAQYGFMLTTLSITVGFAVLIFSWMATMWGGSISLKTPMLFSVGAGIMLILSGLDGIMLGSPVLDEFFHESYWVVSHFHYTLFGGVIMGFFGAVYYWFPAMTGRMYNERLGRWHFYFTAVFAPLTFLGLAKLGEHGMIRRYADYTYHASLQSTHELTTVAAFLLGVGQVIFVVNALMSLRSGEKTEEPWEEERKRMPSPEWDGMPYTPPTPSNVSQASPDGGADTGTNVETDGGVEDE